MTFNGRTLAAFCLGLLASLQAAALGRAEPPPPARAPVLNADAVPFITAAGRRDYLRFLEQATPRAFAVSADGSWGWAAALLEFVEGRSSRC
jgi:hypothetical protein